MGRGWAAAAFIGGALVVGLLSGCSPSATYLGSTSQGLYLKVPTKWTVFNSATLQRLGLVNPNANALSAAEGATYPAFVTLSSANRRLVSKNLAGPYPWAMAAAFSVGSQDQASLSLQGLEDVIFNVDQAEQAGQPVAALSPTKTIVRGALRGTQVSFELATPNGPLDFEQVALLNSPTNKLWLLVTGCSPACFNAHRHVLDDIVRSFTVTGQDG